MFRLNCYFIGGGAGGAVGRGRCRGTHNSAEALTSYSTEKSLRASRERVESRLNVIAKLTHTVKERKASEREIDI